MTSTLIKLSKSWPGIHCSVSHFPHSVWMKCVKGNSSCEGKLHRAICECMTLAGLNSTEKEEHTCPPDCLTPEEKPCKK